MIFPTFKFNRDSIPLGDSSTLCISISWATLDRIKIFIKYKLRRQEL